MPSTMSHKLFDEREGDIAEAPAPKESSPTGSMGQSPSAEPVGNAASHAPHEFGGFDEFDPRGPVSGMNVSCICLMPSF